MNYHVSDMLKEVGDALGFCIDSETGRREALEVFNRAQRQLMAEQDFPSAYVDMKLPVKWGASTLPPEIEQIQFATLCNQPVRMEDPRERFLFQGDGVEGDDCKERIEDLGDGFATWWDWPAPKRLMALSDQPEAEGAIITFNGRDPANRLVSQGLEEARESGETVPLRQAHPCIKPHYTRNKFAAPLISVKKPVTNGYVHLYTFTPSNDVSCWVSVMAPDATSPCYRRVTIRGVQKEWEGSIFVRARIRWRRQYHDLEKAILQCPDAIYYMALALDAEEDDAGKYSRFKNKAVKQLSMMRRRQRTAGANNLPNIKVRPPGFKIRSV